jgi:hypothetical protein
MFLNDELQEHLTSSETIEVGSGVVAEWNMNHSENINIMGNYRYRSSEQSSIYSSLIDVFDPSDSGLFYSGATDADAIIDGGLNDQDIPTVFRTTKQKEKMLFSLEECFGRFRPRSGINKARYFEYGKYLHHANAEMARRPRYYPAHKDDPFKYWTSYRTENGEEFGIANRPVGSEFYIEDTNPFVVYKEPVPANRVIVKMQTNVGDINQGPFSNQSGSFNDPFFGQENSTVPSTWSIQYLTQDSKWVDAISFNALSTRKSGAPIVGPDGYVEIQYGLEVPEEFETSFILVDTIYSESMLPQSSVFGQAYLVKDLETSVGSLRIWDGSSFKTHSAKYGWMLVDEGVNPSTAFVNKFSNLDSFLDSATGKERYREIEYIYGLRVSVKSMKVFESSFDLIELSPRLVANITEYTSSFDITKSASDLGVNGLPVSQLLASTGSLSLFDFDGSFNKNNSESIISKYLSKNIQIKFYEIIKNVNNSDFYVPIKTMYVEGFPSYSDKDRIVTMVLRDLFFYFESLIAPEILITDVSLTYAVSVLLDSIGFSNYVFKRVSSDKDIVIPYFYIAPNTSVADVLAALALSAQCSMFFDEYNNFILMQKNYMMPTVDERETSLVLNGSKDYEKTGILLNGKTSDSLANIIEVESQENSVYNAGQITYTSRYIQKSYGSIRQASLVDKEKTWIYKPALLWEVSASENTKSINNESSNQSGYILSAIPLNSDLVVDVPQVVGHQLRNNVMDLGEGIYWIGRYNGYFYSGGEIIKYDAVEYSVAGVGNVWISSAQEYSEYFSRLTFNGKIYPTGLVRIYSEPYYEVVSGATRLKNGAVRAHGRGQFGTDVVQHSAGINPYWTSDDNVKNIGFDSRYIFYPQDKIGEISTKTIESVSATKSSRNGIIKNFLSTEYSEDSEINKLKALAPGTIQSSALIVNGPSYSVEQNPLDYLTSVSKELNSKFTHFGTRMRIIGKIENNENKGQTPTGAMSYYTAEGQDPAKSTTISGGSGGIAFLVNKGNQFNSGYYYEIIALTENNIDQYEDSSEIYNIVFYKINPNGTAQRLWGGLTRVLVDDGKFTGQARMVSEENPTVYDLAAEYQDIGKLRRFSLFLNGKSIATVDDTSPLAVHSNASLFVRGSSRCMFENLYAIANNYSQNTAYPINTPIMSALLDDEIGVNEAFNKYALSGVVQSAYLSGLSPIEPPRYNIYYEEFGTIMREAAYFNVKYDKAYPALYAKLSPTFNRIKGYASAGFMAGSYGAEFLIFNSTDTVLNLDESSGNYLRIQGVTFTQQSPELLTVDDYFKKRSDFSNPEVSPSGEVLYPLKYDQEFADIKASRNTHGRNEFSIDAEYIQTADAANDLMGWVIGKLMKPRKSVGVSIFANPTIQLGDIVSINYLTEGYSPVANPEERFVVYSIAYSKSSSGPSMSIYLSEVK